MQFAEQQANCRVRLEAALDRWLPSVTTKPERLHQAMRYAALGAGKYVRPMLVYASGAACGALPASLDGGACAVELVHTYSLIHDDLPAMDNDDLRRGRPTCHKAFDEATAILAGDGLHVLAFQVLSEDPTILAPPEQRLLMIKSLAQACGPAGMIGGQAIDLEAVGSALKLDDLQEMHSLKTGSLIRASVQLGALCAPAQDEDRFASLTCYADCIGLAFQIKDDVLDLEADTATLGKPQGSDVAQNKPTYPGLLGLAGAKKAAQETLEQAIEHLAALGKEADSLRQLASYMVQRDH